MCQIIRKIFDFGIVSSLGLSLFGALWCGYKMIARDQVDADIAAPLIRIFSFIFGVFMIAEPCQNCVNNAAAISSLVFERSSNNFFNTYEQLQQSGFALQIMSQKISFAPKNLFTIDYKLVFNVS
jgi:hypothetical protein